MKITPSLLKGILLIILVSSTSFAAAFRQLTPLINIPTAKEFHSGDIEFLASLSVAKPLAKEGETAEQFVDHDFDFLFSYNLTDRTKAGIAMFTPENFAGYFHTTFFHNGILGMGGGLTHITQKDSLSAREEYPTVKENAYTSYLTFSLNFLAGILHFGVGNKEFVPIEGSNGYFYGLEFPGLGGAFLTEFDGRNFHFGYRIKAHDQTKVYFAHTEIAPTEAVNAQYNDAPKRYFALALSHSQNVSNFFASQKDEVEAYKESFQALQDDYMSLKDEIQMERELLADSHKLLREEIDIFKEIMSDSMDTRDPNVPTRNIMPNNDREVLELYNQSFIAYQEKDYYKAIEVLSKAIEIKADAAFLYTRLGSIYYELGRKDLALDSWETALEYDPNNQELIQLLSQ